jgi:hypothetical protein
VTVSVANPGANDDRPDRVEVTDPDAIRMLTDLRSLRYLMPFLAGRHTLTSAAAVLDKRPSTLAYWIPRMVACGLLVHVDDEARAGAAMPVYRAPAREFTVPYGSIPIERRVALLDEGRMQVLRRFLDGVDEALESAGGFALSFRGHGDSGTVVDLVEPAQHQRTRTCTDAWRMLTLDEDDAHELADEMEAMIARYAARGGRSRYVVHVGIARNPRFRWRSANDDLSD